MNLIRYFLVALLATVLAACGGGGGSAGTPGGATPVVPVALPLFTTAPASLTTAVGAAQEFSITGGSSPYSVVSNDAAVVTAGVNGSKLTIGGIASGAAIVLIRDAVGATVSVNVTVRGATLREIFTTAASNIVASVGLASAQTYNVGGGTAPYTATSSNASVAAAVLTGNNLTVIGLVAGSANIVIRDSVGASITVAVTVQVASNVALFTTAPTSLTVAIGNSLVYTVGGGSGSGYVAISSNVGVATVNLAGTNLTVSGVAVGSANVVVRDSSGATVTFNVVVGAIPLAITPGGATGIINDILIATITGGTPPYRASVGNVLVANASIQNANELRVQLLQAGTTIATVLDANNQSVAFTLTSGTATPGIRLSPGAVTISEFDSQPIVFTVFGAAGAINAFSSDVTRLSATVAADNRTVTLTTGSNGNRCVTADLPVTITVIDSTRATGVATVTIKDNGVVCP